MDIDHEIAHHHEDRGAVHKLENQGEQEYPQKDGVELYKPHLAQDVSNTIGKGVGLVGTVAEDVSDVAKLGLKFVPKKWNRISNFLGKVSQTSHRIANKMKKTERVLEHPIQNGGSSVVKRAGKAIKVANTGAPKTKFYRMKGAKRAKLGF